MDILINQHESRFRIVFMNNLFGENINIINYFEPDLFILKADICSDISSTFL